jgi:catechol 2,3-dioxygenase-like lactoylglutathione lyase family enzyme
MDSVSEIQTKVSSDDVPVPSQIAHFVAYTSRFEEMVKWYKNVLHLRPSHEDENFAFLTYDAEHHRVALVRVPGLGDRLDGHVGIHHVAFTYRTLHDMLVTHERLAADGILPYWAVNHGPTISLYYNDPDKNRVEMQVDNFDTAEEAIAYCAGPEFAENPIGVDVDPSALLKKLRDGTNEAELKIRPNIGPRDLSSGFPIG